jgi:hypothetical protein
MKKVFSKLFMFKGVVGVNETSAEENFSIFLEFSWEKKITKIGSNQPIIFSFRRA